MDEDLQSLEERDPSEESQQELEKEPSVEEEEVVDPRTLLTQEQVNYFKAIFESLDAQKKGKITTKSIGLVLRMMGLNPTKAQIKNHVEEIDPLKKGVVDFASFLLPIAQRIDEEPESPEEIIEAFRVLANDDDDDDDSDYVTSTKLYEYLTTLGEDLEDFEIELLLKMAETKGTGRIYYQDFIERLLGLKKLAKNKKESKKGGKKKKLK